MTSVLARGAEAIVSKVNDKIVKVRPKKSYRIDVLDNKLRKLRTRHEARLLDRLKERGIPCPLLLSSDEDEATLEMSFIEGEKLRDVLNDNVVLAGEMGRIVGLLHKYDVIHADLTTSNFVFDGKLHIIDFGLSFVSLRIEDKAVDLHLLDRALESRHHSVYPEVFKLAVKGYEETNPFAGEVLAHLKKVQLRGRNKRK